MVTVLANMESTGDQGGPERVGSPAKVAAGADRRAARRDPRSGGRPSTPTRPSSSRRFCSASSACRSSRRPRPEASTDIEVLEAVRDGRLAEEKRRVPQLMVEYRQLTKLVGTYLVNLKDAIHADTGRIHASFHQTGAATGRLSSQRPEPPEHPDPHREGRRNPHGVRRAPGLALVSADYSQIELRMLAHSAGAGPDRSVRQTAGHPRRRRCGGVRRRPGRGHRASSARTPRRSTSASSTASRPTAWHGASRGSTWTAAKKLIADYKARFTRHRPIPAGSA